jgi:hypothetical protein
MKLRVGVILAVGLLILVFSYAPCFSQSRLEDKITITTYYPSPYGSYNQLQTNTLGVGDNDGDGGLDSGDVPNPTTNPGEVWIKGNVGIGTMSPNSPAPNGQSGNLDVNDIWVRSANNGSGEWFTRAVSTVWLGSAGVLLREGAAAQASCSAGVTATFLARYQNGRIQTRTYYAPFSGPACDSGWVDGPEAECLRAPAHVSKAKATIIGVEGSYQDLTEPSTCSASGLWQ